MRSFNVSLRSDMARVFLAMFVTITIAACESPDGGVADAEKVASVDRTRQPETTSLTMDARAATARWILNEGLDDARQDEERLSIASGADDVRILPMERSGDARGNAILSLRFDNYRERPDRLVLNVDGKRYAFDRNADDPMWYSGWVDFDFELFAQEQRARRSFVVGMKSIGASGELGVPKFSGRAAEDIAPLGFVGAEALSRARNESTPIEIKTSALAMLPAEIAPQKELVINSLGVVRDPARTFDPCGNFGTGNGAWTFARLTRMMANQNVTGINAAQFVEDWLKQWSVARTVNGEGIPARTAINQAVLAPWPKLPDGRLDIEKAPFRLLAIVNRLDLRKNTAEGLDAGELRFVFGVVDRRNGKQCAAQQFTVIFEYKVPLVGCQAVKNYAQRWMALKNLAPGSAEYNLALEKITRSVTGANVAPDRINGSALSQIRTNEIMLAPPWQLREFRLGLDGRLHSSTVAQTPRRGLNATTALGQFVGANAASVLAHRHFVPLAFNNAPFRAGAITNLGDDFWRMGGVSSDVRHAFSLDTCNGCHGGETKSPSGDIPFLHIAPRQAGSVSALSKFLVGDGSLSSPRLYTKQDPSSGPPRQLGDLVRRQADLAALANSSCSATGLLEMVTFKETTNVH